MNPELFICSPIKLVKLLFRQNAVTDKLSQTDPNWFLSKRGKLAYKKAKTIPEKTRFFYQYLLSIAKKPRHFEEQHALFLQKIAFIMAYAMDDTETYGGYKKILDPHVNPFLERLRQDSNQPPAHDLIQLFHPEKAHGEKTPLWGSMTPPATDGSHSELYRIERTIVGVMRPSSSLYSFSTDDLLPSLEL